LNSTHPLFLRIKQRDSIFNEIDLNILCIDGDDKEINIEFTKIFNLPIEEQSRVFSAPDSKYPKIFANLLYSRTLPQPCSLLCAFIDRLLDFDFTTTISSLIPYKESIITSCSTILTSHSCNKNQYPFLIRTILLLQGTLLSESDTIEKMEVSQTFLSTVLSLLQEFKYSTLALEGLKRFLRCDPYRIAFIESGGISLLIQDLVQARALPHTDTLYHILFCLWALTFDAEGNGKLSSNEFVSELAKLLTTIQPEREEIVRLLTFIISQLNQSPFFIESAYDNDIFRLFKNFEGKHYVDAELNKDISTAAEDLRVKVHHLSLWDKYIREINSGTLRFTQTHKSDVFWKVNIERFGENNYYALKQLKQLLTTGDEETIEVACHDLGEYAQRHVYGRVRLQELEVKEEVMRLLAHPSQKVQLQALRTTQILLIHSS
jgi:V-type H+-transporting ATPase subunit H